MAIQNWLLGGGLALILGFMGLLLRVSYRIGGDARNITQGLERITKMETAIEAIPIMKKDIENLHNLYNTVRSDFKELRKDHKESVKITRRGSRPDIGENE